MDDGSQPAADARHVSSEPVGGPGAPLRRILGPVSVACVGVGVAIGSGIFATPGEAAKHLHSPGALLSIWVVAGFVTLLQSFVTAELATRFPRAGGEYQFLREAYGDFAAFFFGWSFTIFIVGGGAGTIAAAFGEFIAELLVMDQPWSAPLFGCAAIAAVTTVNALGLRTGAVTQNLLTFLKTSAVVAIAVGALLMARRAVPAAQAAAPTGGATLESYLLALLPAFWSYSGANDSAKLAEETRDVNRALPRALLATVTVLTVVYCFYNYALLCAARPDQMAGVRSVPAMIFAPLTGYPVNEMILIASALVCLGALSSTFLANIRVTYAMARDGLTFRALGRMSAKQAPVASLVVGAVLACAFVVNRRFEDILRIYFLASALLFGLTYASMIVFRLRDRREGRAFPSNVFRTPFGMAVAGLLIVIELAIGASIISSDLRTGSRDSLMTLALLTALAVLYVVWKAVVARFAGAGHSGGRR